MSNQQAAVARLEGFDGPYFPDRVRRGLAQGMHRVQKRFGYHPERINQMLLDEVAARLKGKVRMYVTTSDAYMWTGAVEFPHNGKRYCILFPMLHDSGKGDGTYADRSAAFYAMAASSEEQRLEAMTAFAKAFVDIYRSMYYNSIRHSKGLKGIDA